MNRYFLEVAYKGSRYSGFQIQENALTVQSETERALAVYFRKPVELTGSSRTDAGVHALQNYFHFDLEEEIPVRAIYNLNSILPEDIAIHSITLVRPGCHCRFDAISRQYRYDIYRKKNPFLKEFAYYYPYEINFERLTEIAEEILGFHDFTSFSKRNTQVKTFNCTIMDSRWVFDGDRISYYIKGNRFLRGMVRGLVGTMLKLARKGEGAEAYRDILEGKDCRRADFAVPGGGLWLEKVEYPEGYFEEGKKILP